MLLTHGPAFDLDRYRARLLDSFLALVMRPPPTQPLQPLQPPPGTSP